MVLDRREEAGAAPSLWNERFGVFPPSLQVHRSPNSGGKGEISGWAGNDQNWELLTDCLLPWAALQF